MSAQEYEIQPLDDWEILDGVCSSGSMSPVMVPTPPPPPPPPYSHLPAWLYAQICEPILQQQQEGSNDGPIFISNPLNKVRELQDSFLGAPGFEDIPLAENRQSDEFISASALHSCASVGRLVSASSAVGGGSGQNSSKESFMMLASDLKVSKSLSDLTTSAKDVVHVPEDKENCAPKSAMTILLMGDSVESWAAVGNKIIGLNVFAASSHNNNHPLRLQRASVTRNNTRITLVTIPVLRPLSPLPPSLKTQLTSLLLSGVDAILVAGGWYGSLDASVDALLKHVRSVVGDEAADHVLMLFRRPQSEAAMQEREEQKDKKSQGEGEPCVQQIVQQAATRTLTVTAWNGMTEKQINKVVDMAYKLSINQGKLKVSCTDKIPLQKWPDLSSSRKFDYVMVQRGGLSTRVGEEGICKVVNNVKGWLNRFRNRFNHSMRWVLVAGFGATLASIFAAPLFGIGGGMVKPIIEIVNISSGPMLGYETHYSQKSRPQLQNIYY